jgi:hypothetical protein
MSNDEIITRHPPKFSILQGGGWLAVMTIMLGIGIRLYSLTQPAIPVPIANDGNSGPTIEQASESAKESIQSGNASEALAVRYGIKLEEYRALQNKLREEGKLPPLPMPERTEGEANVVIED